MAVAIDRETVVVCRGDVLAAVVGDEIVLLDSEQGKYFGLNDIGSDVWNRLAAPTRGGDLFAALTAAYSGDAAVIESDILDLLGRLVDAGLVRLA